MPPRICAYGSSAMWIVGTLAAHRRGGGVSKLSPFSLLLSELLCARQNWVTTCHSTITETLKLQGRSQGGGGRTTPSPFGPTDLADKHVFFSIVG